MESLAHLVLPANVASQDPQVPLDQRVMMVPLVILAFPVLLDQLERVADLASLACRDPKDTGVSWAVKEGRDQGVSKVSREPLEVLDLLVPLDLVGLRDLQAKEVVMGIQELRESEERTVNLAPLALLAPWAPLEIQDSLVLWDKRVTVVLLAKLALLVSKALLVSMVLLATQDLPVPWEGLEGMVLMGRKELLDLSGLVDVLDSQDHKDLLGPVEKQELLDSREQTEETAVQDLLVTLGQEVRLVPPVRGACPACLDPRENGVALDLLDLLGQQEHKVKWELQELWDFQEEPVSEELQEMMERGVILEKEGQ